MAAKIVIWARTSTSDASPRIVTSPPPTNPPSHLHRIGVSTVYDTSEEYIRDEGVLVFILIKTREKPFDDDPRRREGAEAVKGSFFHPYSAFLDGGLCISVWLITEGVAGVRGFRSCLRRYSRI